VGSVIAPALAFSLLGAALTARVVDYGWVSDDAMITYRYVQNLLAGYGPVFNVGERVQGYTHPLWFGVLAAASAMYSDPVYLSVVLGAIFTLTTFAFLSLALSRAAGDWRRGFVATAALVAVLASSDAWLSFQTSGLENSLAHLLLALLVGACAAARPPRLAVLAALCTLLLLTRPDFALLVAPVALFAAWQHRREPRELMLAALACAPLLAWLAFAWAYYGKPLPNTASAKLGIYAGLDEAAEQGLRYLWDWFRYEPVPLVAASAFAAYGIAAGRGPYPKLLGLGAFAYLIYVILIGGDFMRGRFLVPCFVVAAYLGSFALAARLREAPPLSGINLARSVAVLGLLFAGWQLGAPRQDGEIGADGVVNERRFYSGFQLAAYRDAGRLVVRDLDITEVAGVLKGYAERCGPFALHWGAPGTLGFLAGPDVTLVDSLGLTDEYVAGLPRSSLVFSPPRPGHPFRYVPVSYLARRGDVSLIPGWYRRVEAGDCTLRSEPAALAGSSKVVNVYTGEIVDPP
jgi:arabinofuranosyltransferase